MLVFVPCVTPSLRCRANEDNRRREEKSRAGSAKPVGEVVQYEALEQNVGKDIVDRNDAEDHAPRHADQIHAARR